MIDNKWLAVCASHLTLSTKKGGFSISRTTYLFHISDTYHSPTHNTLHIMPKRKHEEIVENDSAHSDSDNDKFDFEDEVAFDDSEEESGEESQGDSGSELDDDDEFDDDEITGKG